MGGLTVFIDTNPAFSVYTECAVAAADRLLIPINSDDFRFLFLIFWRLYSLFVFLAFRPVNLCWDVSTEVSSTRCTIIPC